MSLPAPPLIERVTTLPLRAEGDVVQCRQQARLIASLLGFEHYDEVRVALAASEAARFAVRGGLARSIEFAVQFSPENARLPELVIRISHVRRSAEGLGIEPLVDHVEYLTVPGGEELVLRKRLSVGIDRGVLRERAGTLPSGRALDAEDELAAYNRELIEALEDANQRRLELQRINDELTETNRGVVALYDELDTLHRVGRVVASQLELDSLLQAITDATIEVSGAEMGAFLVKAPEADHFTCHTSRGPLCGLLETGHILSSADLFNELGVGEVLRIDDLREEESLRQWPHQPVRSYLAVAVKNAEEGVAGVLVFAHREPGTFSERTERILASVALQASIGVQNAQLYRSVQAASAAKDSFLAMLSHELRTPLNPVFMLLASLEQNRDLPQEARDDLLIIRRNLQLEARLIDDMLDLTRIVRGKIALHFETVDLHSVLPLVRDVCQEQIGAQQVETELRLEAIQSCVVADSTRLQQVFWNLLSNALKFSRGGKVLIVSSNPTPETVRVEVIDNGRGIRPETLKSIFQPFEQGDLATNATYGGLGLGLTISKKVIDAHGGQIFAESGGLGHGARFVVELRTAECTGTAIAPHQPASPAAARSGARILLVEDHQDTLQTLQRLLSRRGFETACANTAQIASVLADKQKFDLVISDVGLPDRSGLELMRELKEKHQLRGIALSGYGMEADIERSHAAGFVAHLIKPIDFAALEKAIAWVLTAKGAG